MARTDLVVGKDKERAGAVSSESPKSAKQKGKGVLYALLLIRTFAYFNNVYRSTLRQIRQQRANVKLLSGVKLTIIHCSEGKARLLQG